MLKEQHVLLQIQATGHGWSPPAYQYEWPPPGNSAADHGWPLPETPLENQPANRGWPPPALADDQYVQLIKYVEAGVSMEDAAKLLEDAAKLINKRPPGVKGSGPKGPPPSPMYKAPPPVKTSPLAAQSN